jgi:hypothetical protein
MGNGRLDYRLYLLDAKGHIRSSVDLDCEDDEAAKAVAEGHRHEHRLELWQRDRFVGVFEAVKKG